MPGSDVIDVHYVEARIDIRRHSARGGVEHQLTCRCGLDVARTHGRRWIDDDDGHAGPRRLACHFFRKELRAFVMADHVVQGDRSAFFSRRTVGGNADGGDAARVNDSPDRYVARGIQDVTGPVDVGVIQGLGITGPEPIIRRGVKQCRATLERTLERRPVREITPHHLHRKLPQIAAVGAYAREDTNLPTRGAEGPCDRCADEAGCAGNQRLHATRGPATSGVSKPARATAARERVAARYRCARRINATSSSGANVSPPRRRRRLKRPARLAANTAWGSASAAVSTITRTAMNGRPKAAATSATLKLSISTATAPVSRKADALSATESIGAALVSRAPAAGRHSANATQSRSRQSVDVMNRPPLPDTISVGRTTVPALKLGSRPPANPKLKRPAAPASTRLRAALAARAPPMPPTASNAPSLKEDNPSRRRTAFPKVRASAARAATTPTRFNARVRGASTCGRQRVPTVGNTRKSRDIANRTRAESRAP